MKKIIILMFICLPLMIYSQDYRSALGLKMGIPGTAGINGKFYLGSAGSKLALDNTISTNFGNNNRFLMSQIILEYNKPFGLNEGYNWYAGAGPNINYYISGGYLNNDGSAHVSKLFLRTDALFGLEYTAPTTRLNAAVEGGPSIFVYPIVKFDAFFVVAVRYKLM